MVRADTHRREWSATLALQREGLLRSGKIFGDRDRVAGLRGGSVLLAVVRVATSDPSSRSYSTNEHGDQT